MQAQAKLKTIIKAIIPLLAIAAVAWLLEFAVFNLPAVETMGLGEGRTVSVQGSAQEDEDGTRTIMFRNIDERVVSVEFHVESEEVVEGTFIDSDEGAAADHPIGKFKIVPGDPNSRFYIVDAHGEVARLGVQVECDDAVATQLETLTINVPIPFDVRPVRVFSIIAAIALAWYMRPRSGLFARVYTPNIRTSVAIWCVLALATLATFLVFTLTTVEAKGTYDQTADRQYYELAQAFASGSLSLSEEPPARYAYVNAYDPTIRASIGEMYLWDHAYFNGKYYVYFGVLPALIFHVPFYLLTGGQFPNYIAVACMMLVCMLGFVYLANNIVKRWFPNVSWGAYICALSILVIGSWSVFYMKNADVYTLPIATGLACALFALAFWVKSTAGVEAKQPTAITANPINIKYATIGTLFAALTLASRPQFIAVGLLGLVLFADAMRNPAARNSKVAIAFAPLAVVAIGMGIYNYARFGNPFDLGASYNLTSNDMTHRGFIPDKVPESLFEYFLAPPNISNNYPYFDVGPQERWYLGYSEKRYLYGGILPLTPVLLASIFLIGAKLTKGRLIKTICTVSIAAAMVLAVMDGVAAGVLSRYMCELSFFLAVPAAITQLAYGAPRQPEQTNNAQNAVQLTLTLALALTVGIQLIGPAIVRMSGFGF